MASEASCADIAALERRAATGDAATPQMTLTTIPWLHFDRPDQIARWDALAHWASEPNPFYESWYLIPSLRSLDTEGDVRMLCFEADGQLAGLIPIVRASSYYGYSIPHIRNWVHDNCFCGTPLVAKGLESAFWRALLEWTDNNTRSALFLHLMQMPADGIVHQALADVLAEQARPAATVLHEERAMLASDLDAQRYFDQSLTTKKRKELRRQHRRLGEYGELEVERSTGPEGAIEWAREFLELEARGWKGRAGSALANSSANTDLFEQALEISSRRGRLERLALRLDGRPIAMLANFITPPGAFSFKTAFDEDYARYSPGVLLQGENLKILERGDIDWVDSCATQDHKMIDHIWRERRPVARHSIGIGGFARKTLFRMLAWRETGKFVGTIA